MKIFSKTFVCSLALAGAFSTPHVDAMLRRGAQLGTRVARDTLRTIPICTRTYWSSPYVQIGQELSLLQDKVDAQEKNLKQLHKEVAALKEGQQKHAPLIALIQLHEELQTVCQLPEDNFIKIDELKRITKQMGAICNTLISQLNNQNISVDEQRAITLILSATPRLMSLLVEQAVVDCFILMSIFHEKNNTSDYDNQLKVYLENAYIADNVSLSVLHAAYHLASSDASKQLIAQTIENRNTRQSQKKVDSDQDWYL